MKAYREWLLTLSDRDWKLMVLVVHPVVISIGLTVVFVILRWISDQ